MALIDIVLSKADPISSGEAVPAATIYITAQLPPLGERSGAQLDLFFDTQAGCLERTLSIALPGGTYDRLLARMLDRKASHLRVPYAASSEANETKEGEP